MIIAGEQLSNPLQRITIKMLEVPYSQGANQIPAVISKSENLGSVSESPFIASDTNERYVDVFGTGFSVLTQTRGGSVNDIFLNESAKTLVVYLTSEDSGELTIRLPRDLIDAKEENGSNASFIAFTDGYETYHEEYAADNTYRTINISFPTGTERVEIVGTEAIPEFPFPLIGLVIGLSIIAAYRQLR